MHTFTSLSHLKIYLFILVLLSGCSPDPDVAEQQSNNAQNQLVNVRIEAILENPIESPMSNTLEGEGIQMLTLGAVTMTTLRNDFPSNVGQNTLSQTINLAPSGNLGYSVQYWDYYYQINSGYGFSCNQITLNIYANDVLFHTWTKEMGGNQGIGNCADGYIFQGNVIIPNG